MCTGIGVAYRSRGSSECDKKRAPSFFRADNVRREHAVPQSRTLPTNARPTRAPISINSVSRVWCEEVIMHMCT
ncbi:uncharacterized protein LOC112692426 isoform X3 [Sipha flava]|uniref:Uncharacterized protein LOC112692426 isoform X3 n=1 Tax=Sipha flava TaxID=143950 RepID=A0A8B8GIY8_9HEMI|nr:uncharacterized protein LOC112692426 isoform X3 [Sipha flava]